MQINIINVPFSPLISLSDKTVFSTDFNLKSNAARLKSHIGVFVNAMLKDKKPKNSGENWVAPNAVIIGDVTLEKNSSVWFNATLRGDIENIYVGEGSNVQDGCVLHTDPGCPLKIGKNVTVGHLVMLHGCTIGDNSLIGIGAVILNKAKIGKNCIIGAKALITENKVIPDNSLVIGSPGKIIRQVTQEEKKAVDENTKHYQDNWKRYSQSIF